VHRAGGRRWRAVVTGPGEGSAPSAPRTAGRATAGPRGPEVRRKRRPTVM
jgi:hypothetical protein